MKPLALTLLIVLAAFADTDRPQLVSSTPAQGQEGVIPDTQITLVFSKPMDAISLTTLSAFTLYDLTNGYRADSGFGSLSSDGTTATLYSYSLRAGAAYRLELNAAILKDRSGNLLAPVPPILFNTFFRPDKTAPKVAGTVPADSETGVATNTAMYVVFDRPIATLPYDGGISVSAASGPLKFTSAIANDRILQIKTALLLPVNQQITVSVAGVVDRNGTTLPVPVVFSFQTGTLPDGQQQGFKLKPPEGTPTSLPLHIEFVKPIDPPLFAVGSVIFQGYNQNVASDTYPATFALADDHRSLTVNAAGQLPPGKYSVVVSVPFDRTMGRLNALSFAVTIGAGSDPTPVRLLAASPPDGALDVPVSAAIRLAFSGPIDLAGAPGAFSVTVNGNSVPGDLTLDAPGAVVTFKPRTPLQPSTTYTVSMSGINDYAANPVDPYSGSFTVRASGTYADAFQLLSIDPPARAAGVDPSSPITITFNHPVDPVSLYTSTNGISDSSGSVMGDYSVNGAVVTFHPKYPMAPGNVTVRMISITDLGGAVAPGFTATFSVAGAQLDTTAPVVSSVVPADGATVLYSGAHVELTFSKPLNLGTVFATIPGGSQAPLNFTAFRDGSTSVPLRLIYISNSRVALEFNAPPGAVVTLFATAGLADSEGNSLTPFRTTVRTSEQRLSGAAQVIRQIPFNSSSGVPVDSAIIAYWSAPLDRASVEQNMLVYSSRGFITGRFEWTSDSRAFSFISTVPFPDGIRVTASLVSPAHDAAGLPIEFHSSFSTAFRSTASESGALSVTGTNVPLSIRVPLNFVFDVQFSQDLPDAFLKTAIAAFGKYQQQPVYCPFVKVRPRVLRFKLPIPLVAGATYSFALDAWPILQWNTSFTADNTLASPHPVVTAAGPVASNAAQNSVISILFSEPINKLSMPGAVKVMADGVEVPMRFTWTSDQALSLQPVFVLKPEINYTVVLAGFDNLAGIPVPDHKWTFRTGSGIDTKQPSLLRILPSGSNVSPDATVSLTFDESISPDFTPGPFQLVYAAGPAVPTTLGFSEDLKTIYLRPNARLAAGSQLAIWATGFRDFAGNTVTDSLSRASFEVGYGGTTLSTVTGSCPRPDASDVPVNAKIQIQSNTNISSLNGVVATLTENGNPLDASLSVEGAGNILSVVPARPLAANSRIGVTIAGVTAAPYYFGFTTGSDPDVSSPSANAWPAVGLYPVAASVVVHLRFNEPLNPLSVNTDRVTLKSSNGAFLDAIVSLDDTGRVVTLTPRLSLTDGVRYTVDWSVSDLAGNKATSGTAFTVGPPDTVTTALLGIDPADNANDVSTRPLIQAFFTRPVDLTLGDGSFRLLLEGVPVPGALTVTGSQLAFAPFRALQPGASYRIELRGAADAFGNAVPDVTSNFTVASPGDTLTPLRLLSSTPVNLAVGVPADAPIRLTFNKPVTTGSALSITASGGSFFRSFLSARIEGNDVVIQPTVPFIGGSQVSVRGTALDSAGSSAPVFLSYTISPVPDTTPPVLEYTLPAAGSTIKAFGTNLILRFSEPVIKGFRAISLIGATNPWPDWNSAADGRTFSSFPDLKPDSDITIAISSDVTDLAGNPIAPVSFQLRSLSEDESRVPVVKSMTPPAGAINVPVDASIQLQFTHVMEPVLLSLGLHVTADGIPITGSITASADARSFQFKPDIQFRKGALVAVFVGSPAQDVASQRLNSFNSSFTVVKDPAVSAAVPIALAASTTAIDVRFDAALDRNFLSPFIRSGFERISSRWELRDSDWLRVVPDEPLQADRQYRLVLDDHTEFPLRLSAASTESEIESVRYDGVTVRVRFDREINPLTVSPQTLQLVKPDGSAVLYFLELALDRCELVLRPATSEPELTIVVNGPESAGGANVRRQRHRLVAPPH